MRYEQLSPVPPFEGVTRILVIACAAVGFFQLACEAFGVTFFGYRLEIILGLVPYLVLEQGWVWQVVTYLFLHGNGFHLLLNMLILWYFGAEMEMQLGRRQFLFYFFLCGIGAGLFNIGIHALVGDSAQMMSPIIGASGAIYGILVAYGYFFAERYFLVFFLFPMKAKYFVWLMAGLELWMGVQDAGGGKVAHFAHLGGMVVGAAYLFFRHHWPRGGGKRRDAERERLKRQFTLIVNPSDTERKDRGPYWN